MNIDKNDSIAPNQGKIQLRLRGQGNTDNISGTLKRSGLNIMYNLIQFVAPLMGIMMITISMGILGFLVAILITVFGAIGIAEILNEPVLIFDNLSLIAIILCFFAISRGILRYLEQYSGHYIAFKLLALIRDKVYKALRKLAPAKLDNKSSGNLISMITSDVELLEVFYAHTIAPIVIGVLTSVIIASIIYYFSPLLSVITVIAYLCIGLVIPYITSLASRDSGREYRENMGEINTSFIESLYGMRELILFNQGQKREQIIIQKTMKTNKNVKKMKEHLGITKALTETAVLLFSMIMLFTGVYLTWNGQLTFSGFLVSIICLMSSFGPVVTLSTLSTNLLQTFASGERILDLIQEEPITNDITSKNELDNFSIKIQNVDFSYDKETQILSDISLEIPKEQIIGIFGKSGSGKSTVLKLLMRFYETDKGNICYGDNEINEINTKSLRDNISYVTQDTYLFNTTIEENLRIANRKAGFEQIQQACKDASIHDFIMKLPKKYSSSTGELGASLSGGEQQRLGIARAFLHNSKIIFLDEPTSNLDSLNESIILTSLKKHSKGKTIILISHRKSTLSICDKIFNLQVGRIS